MGGRGRSPHQSPHPKHVVGEPEGSFREPRFYHGGDGWGSLTKKEACALHLRFFGKVAEAAWMELHVSGNEDDGLDR